MVQNNFGNFVKPTGRPKTAWQGHGHFSLQNYYRRTVEYFFMIPFASSWLWSKIILEILSSMPDCPKGRSKATPLFRCKIITGERLIIFA